VDEGQRKSFGSDWASRLLLSLILATVLWGWVTATGDPETDRIFPSIPVSIEGLRDGFVLVGDVSAAEVRVTGPRSAVEELTSSEIEAYLDLDDIEQPGTYTVRLTAPKPPKTWDIATRPRSVTVVVESESTLAFPLEPHISGNLGANQQVESVTLSSSEATVTGPASLVNRVAKVELPVDIANRTTDFASVFTPVALDEGGQPIAGVTINPASVSASVEITARGKRVAVIAQVEGEPASGFEVVDRLINPNTVLVDGPPEMLDSLITVNAAVVNISGAEGDVTERVRIVGLPPGISLLEPQSGQVDVVVQIRQRGVQQPLPSQQVTVVNLGEGLSATVSPNTVSVTVIGNQQELERLSPESLVVQVDAEGLGPGSYNLRPFIIVPPNMEWKTVEPTTVTLTISRGMSNGTAATPVASPDASPVQ
jgi:YbbR domain-containing protein